jgi:hypothetical protein
MVAVPVEDTDPEEPETIVIAPDGAALAPAARLLEDTGVMLAV